ncbi:hypothetical protein DSL72_004262 [Monilinia vaccinii-corymbosi]|uniref:Uncharacterized protein n=1 Tax=Monilinia vaccinii-corymbosi TaxID=61207 RepID=A0A8A3NVK8_9HELO|nr:hypothetical protein DSL72_004262 [Monilinia vaccinii-corymbosi]
MSILHVLTPAPTTLEPPSMAAKIDNAQRVPMSDTLSFPDTVLYVHENRPHQKAGMNPQAIEHMMFNYTYHRFWTIFSGNTEPAYRSSVQQIGAFQSRASFSWAGRPGTGMEWVSFAF